MEKKYYVYVHKIPKTNIIFYVGSNWQGANPDRAFEKMKRPKKWIEEIAKHDGKFDVEILARFDNSLEAYRHEMNLMSQYQDKHNWCWCNGERRDDEWKAKVRGTTFSRKIIAIKNNEKVFFESIRYASQQLNIKRPTIHHYLKTGKTHSSGYRFKYVAENH